MMDQLEHCDLIDDSEEEDYEYAPEFVKIRHRVSNKVFSPFAKINN